MKIATYNIMSGGFNSYTSIATQPERLSVLQEAIAKIDADIIGLIDTFRWKELFSDSELSKLFNYPNTYQANLDDNIVDSRIGFTILSKLSIQCEVLRIYDRNCIRATVQSKDSTVEIFVAYFNHQSEKIRHKQAEALTQLIQKNPTMIIGDLNAISSRDVPKVQQRIKGLPQTTDARKILNELFQATAIDVITKAGFSDTSRINEDYSATAHTKMKLPQPVAKVDYIFTSADIEVKSFQTYYGDLFDQASDHYPVAAELIIKS